jgi:hypothetical protein
MNADERKPPTPGREAILTPITLTDKTITAIIIRVTLEITANDKVTSKTIPHMEWHQDL